MEFKLPPSGTLPSSSPPAGIGGKQTPPLKPKGNAKRIAGKQAQPGQNRLEIIGNRVDRLNRPSAVNAPAKRLPKPPAEAGQQSRVPSVGHVRFETGAALGIPNNTVIQDLENSENPFEIVSDKKGQLITDTFKNEGAIVAKEVVNRTDVVGIQHKALSDKKAYLEEQIPRLARTVERLEASGGNPALLEQTKNDLREAKSLLARTVRHLDGVHEYVEKGSTWAASNSFRNFQSSKKVLDAHLDYVPLCVNLRTQAVLDEKGTVLSTVNRSGAISDYRNGNTNLLELEQVCKHLDVICRFTPNIQPHPEILEQCLRCSPILNAQLANSSQAITYGQVYEALKFEAADRALILENQALQDLSAHFSQLSQQGKKDLVESDEVCVGRVSMLNGVKAPVLHGDFVLSEKNQILDMEAVYERLEGKEMVFDGKGPFIDLEGKIHMPVRLKDKQGNIVKKPFQPIYFNISIQGNVENVEPQKSINEKALKVLEARVEKGIKKLEATNPAAAADVRAKLEEVKKQFEGGVTDGVKLAETTALLMTDLKMKLSINCFSGKDRTGLLGALITFNQLHKISKGLSLNEKKEGALLAKFGRQLLSSSGSAKKVVADNTGFKALKLSIFSLKPLGVGRKRDRLIGTVVRIRSYISAGLTFISPLKGTAGEGRVH